MKPIRGWKREPDGQKHRIWIIGSFFTEKGGYSIVWCDEKDGTIQISSDYAAFSINLEYMNNR